MEVCVDSVCSAINAYKGGASRLELCSALSEGGLTPSQGLLIATKAKVEIPVFCMIRPRGGDFLYTENEVQVMEMDIGLCLDNGADGIVLGCLTESGDVDMPTCTRLISVARRIRPSCPVTFHRAIDLTASIMEAASDVMKLGCNRILTSGGQKTAEKGRDVIKIMIQKFESNGLIIMPGCGINRNNLGSLLEHTGAKEFHGSASEMVKSKMKFTNKDLTLGSNSEEYSVKMTTIESVQAMYNIFMNYKMMR